MDIDVINIRSKQPRPKSHTYTVDGKMYVYVGRPSALGNPFEVGGDLTREEAVERYREQLPIRYQQDPKVKQAIDQLVALGQKHPLVLGCWCAPDRCHAEVLRDFLLSLQGQDRESSPDGPPGT